MTQNPFSAPGYGYSDIAAQASVDARAVFIKKTYLHLVGAILACIAIDATLLTVFSDQLERLLPAMFGHQYSWLMVLGAFMVVSWIADSWARSSVSRPLQYAGLGLYVLAEAAILLPLLYLVSDVMERPELIMNALVVSGVIFGGLSLVVLVTKADFSFLRWALVAGSVIAFGAIVVSIFAGFSLGLWFAAAMVFLMCGVILYQTSNVLHHYHTDQYVAASLALFASIATLFWYVLQIFMSMDD